MIRSGMILPALFPFPFQVRKRTRTRTRTSNKQQQLYKYDEEITTFYDSNILGLIKVPSPADNKFITNKSGDENNNTNKNKNRKNSKGNEMKKKILVVILVIIGGNNEDGNTTNNNNNNDNSKKSIGIPICDIKNTNTNTLNMSNNINTNNATINLDVVPSYVPVIGINITAATPVSKYLTLPLPTKGGINILYQSFCGREEKACYL